MIDLPAYLRQVHGTYSAIATKIEELVLVLNESREDDPHSKALALRIEKFLGSLQQSITIGTRAARSLPQEKRKQFLTLVKVELDQIKELRAFLTLSAKSPKPEVIAKIHALYQEISTEMNRSEALLRT